MKAALATRVLRLETYRKATEDPAIKLAFAKLAILPRTYSGERHVVQISAESESGGYAQYEERPGPGPVLEREPGTLLVMLVGGPTTESAAVE